MMKILILMDVDDEMVIIVVLFRLRSVVDLLLVLTLIPILWMEPCSAG